MGGVLVSEPNDLPGTSGDTFHLANEFEGRPRDELIRLRTETMMRIQANRREHEALVAQLAKLDWALNG